MASILNLIKTYPDVDKSVLKQYKMPESVVTVNDDDRDLVPIDIDIPELIEKNFSMMCPDLEFPKDDLLLGYDHTKWHQIQNFGLPAREQKWSPPKMPAKLAKLQKNCETLDEIYETLYENKELYVSEIKWIKNMWHKRLYGHWVFINGTPTYLDGWNFFYCSFWELDIGLPEYRSRDRKFFLFARYCYNTTSAPFKYRRKVGKNHQYTSKKQDYKKWIQDYEETKRSKPEVAETFFWKDYGMRTCYGFNYPKHRREGATFKAECILYEIITRSINAKGGIQSMDDAHAQAAFLDKQIEPWKSMVFFFKPKFSGSTNPKTVIKFEEPTKKSKTKGTMNVTKGGLGSYINFATTASKSFYDGDKLTALHEDELGKTVLEDVENRWGVLRQCLSIGSGRKIVGFTAATSTVGEMNKGGGTAFFRICKNSHWEYRIPESGQTISGKFNLFIPAYDGLEGFVDEFGNSVIETPETPLIGIDGKPIEIGSKAYIKARGLELLGDGGPKNVEEYHEFTRQHPTKFRECFLASSSDTGFNIKILSERINELEMDEKLQPIQGDFEWEVPFEKVRWTPNPYGKFFVSKILNPEDANLTVEVDGQKCPKFPDRFVSSADPFRFEKTQHRRMSNGGGATFYKRNTIQDPEGKPVAEWKSHKFVCSYNNRVHTKKEYSEDMLKMCIYFGSMMYPENNIDEIATRFTEWGFGGYLLHDYDPLSGDYRVNAGFSSTGQSKPDLFGGLKEYIEVHGYRENHIDILKECIEISGLEEMTDYDLFTSACGCIKGLKSHYSKYIDGILGNTATEVDGLDFGDIIFN